MLRSLRQAHDALRGGDAPLDVARSTIGQWCARDRWVERAKREDAVDAAAFKTMARARMPRLLDLATSRMEKLLADDTAPAMVHDRAAEIVAGWNGLVAPRPGAALDDDDKGTDGPDPTVLARLGSDDLARYIRTGELPTPEPPVALVAD